MKGEFLLEIGTEEIPAGFIPPATDALANLFASALETARISHGLIQTFATPRRLILHAADVDAEQASRETEKTGPARSAAFDRDGNATKAAIGFAKGQGVDVSDLVVVVTPKGEHMAVRKTEEGQPTVRVLAEFIPTLIEKIPFPKTMRWMDLDVRFARPLHWIVALFDGQVVPFGIGNIQSGDLSRGHRFTHPETFAVTGMDQFRTELAKRDVFIDQDQRRIAIEAGIKELATAAGLQVYDDTELLNEITYIVESPHPVMGEFPADFLELPASILITCMRKHQRYFSVRDAEGRITNRFIAVNNTPVKNDTVSIKGHERVLKARLEDARFYFREDRKLPLIDRLESLKGVVFHSKLGTAYEKVERFTFIAKQLAERFAAERIADVERAALLCKCDLETGIVYEFPELQGKIGRYYARMDGEPSDIDAAIEEHYLPAFAGDRLPEGIIGSVISIADRIDTIVGCFSVGLIPTGTADPYALRRHALGIIQILMNLDRPLDLQWLVGTSLALLAEKRTRDENEVARDVLEFIRTRFVNFHTARDFPLDVVEAAVRARFDDVVDARRRVEALNEWKQREDFDAIMTGFKRVVNILKDAVPGNLDANLLVEDAEKALYQAFEKVRGEAQPLIEKGDYAKALEVVTDLKAPIDRLFDEVMVMVEDEKLRKNRLGLLRNIAQFFAQVADFSFIGSTAQTKG